MKIIGITDNLGKEFIDLVLNNKDKFDLKNDYENELYKIAINDKYFASSIYAKFSNPNRVQNLDYKSFYTPELINLVYEKDKILIDHYNLKPDW